MVVDQVAQLTDHLAARLFEHADVCGDQPVGDVAGLEGFGLSVAARACRCSASASLAEPCSSALL